MIYVKLLETRRLVLRKYNKYDFEDYVNWRSQEEYHRFLPTKPKSVKEYKKSFGKIVKNYNNRKNPTLTWAIAKKEDNQVIGSVSIEDIFEEHKLCEIGWGLNPKFQHLGLAEEATRALIEYIFDNTDFNRIQAFIWEGNIASRNLAEKLGFVFEGSDRQARLKDGRFINVWNFGLLRSEWEEIKKQAQACEE